ncbi:pentapeptide repeat-containing protein [Pseudoduganella armeniaca]|uniref:Pentapeptide repeat-containing protein n=1 Tax=Pseudoduganella armeniaca TaxID=2072590 RepID=A0A2R4CC33_9BURK|nr:hypothetical protein [Pseudoduganella armeniaca]AVR97155.1 hypothetical protein C9I28_17035 [Pseudoduganella armeniaca]
MKVHDMVVTGQQLTLSNLEVNILGPGAMLERCDVYSDCASAALVVAGLDMIEGSFTQRDRPLTEARFKRAHFSGVTFSGSFTDCDFGDWDAPARPHVANCDFSEAKLDGCRFLHCDVDTIKFHKWPGFTLTHPAAARDFVLARQWPAKVGMILDIYTDTDPECVAISGDGARIAKKAGISIAELCDLLQAIPGIRIVD